MSDEKLRPEELPIELQPDFFDDDFETPDISEFLDSVSKRFCPECGKPMTAGRPTGRNTRDLKIGIPMRN